MSEVKIALGFANEIKPLVNNVAHHIVSQHSYGELPEGMACWIVKYKRRRDMVDVEWFDHNGKCHRTNNVPIEVFIALMVTDRLFQAPRRIGK